MSSLFNEAEMTNTKKVFWILTIIFISSSSVFAQLNFSLSTQQEYNDNPFHSPVPTKTFISSADFGVENNFNELSIGYYGSYLNFDVIPERNFYWHQFAVWKDFDDAALGFYAEQRIGKDIYTYYNYKNYTFYYQNHFELGPFSISLLPNANVTTYDEINILDNFKASVGLTLNKGFDTGTTFIVGGSLNHKIYLNPTQSGTYTYLDENNLPVEAAYKDRNISSITQLVSFGRIAQSITSSTGLAVQYTNRSIFNKFGSYIKDLNIYYGDESEMFDDPVNYQGNNLGVELTQILFDDLEIKAGYYLNSKFYPSQGVYDQLYNYDTGAMRNDTQNIFNFSVKKNIPLRMANDLNLSLGINYQAIKNNSNSYLFNYTSNSINFNIGLSF